MQTSDAMRREIAKPYPRHCERSEAIHRAAQKERMECFAEAPLTHPPLEGEGRRDRRARRGGVTVSPREHCPSGEITPPRLAFRYAHASRPTSELRSSRTPPGEGEVALTTPLHSKTQTSSPAAYSHPKSASA